jgi:hypothetical protein
VPASVAAHDAILIDGSKVALELVDKLRNQKYPPAFVPTAPESRFMIVVVILCAMSDPMIVAMSG